MTRFERACRHRMAQPARPLDQIAQEMLDRGFDLEKATLYFQRVYVMNAGSRAGFRGDTLAERLGMHRNTLTRQLRCIGLPLMKTRSPVKEPVK